MAKILVIDDTKKHVAAAQTQLEALGHEIVVRRDYAEVFRMSREDISTFDVALIDLMMPAETMTLGERGMEYIGQSIMVGYPLSIFLAQSGVNRVVVVTDTNHHDHPASAIMDHMRPVNINGSVVKYLHARIIDGCKDWGAAFDELMK